jgi:hypothetical protein
MGAETLLAAGEDLDGGLGGAARVVEEATSRLDLAEVQPSWSPGPRKGKGR